MENAYITISYPINGITVDVSVEFDPTEFDVSNVVDAVVRIFNPAPVSVAGSYPAGSYPAGAGSYPAGAYRGGTIGGRGGAGGADVNMGYGVSSGGKGNGKSENVIIID